MAALSSRSLHSSIRHLEELEARRPNGILAIPTAPAFDVELNSMKSFPFAILMLAFLGHDAATQSLRFGQTFTPSLGLREQFSDHPVILTGDLNSMPKSAPYNTLVGTGKEDRPVFLDAFDHSAKKPEGPTSTWNGFEAIVSNRRIDFVFTTSSVGVLRLQTLDDQREGRFPSDHLPVIAEVEIRKK